MAFDIRGFYDRLDQYYAGYDNAATEQFLKDSLAEAESFMIVPSHCCSCDDHMDHTPEEQVEAMSDEERQWILECSDARVAVLNEMACFYRGISEFDKCLTCFRAVEEELQARGMENNSSYAVVELNMAGALRLMGRLDEALETFRKAEAVLLASPNTDDYELAGLYNNTGLVYQDMEKLDLAAENFEKALTYLVKVPDNDAEIATNHANLAITYYKLGKKEEADRCLDKALALFETLDGGMNPHYAGALNTKAAVAYQSGRFEEAAKLFVCAAEKTKQIFGESKDYAVLCRNASAAFAQDGDKASADKYAALAQAVADRIG